LATPDYGVAFNQTKVNRIDIVIQAEWWTIMSNNIEDIYGTTSTTTTTTGPGGGPPTGGPTTGGGGSFSEQTPAYVPCSWYFNGIQWYNVGIRYKGNSSLSGGYQAGNGKLPFRIKFDYYADDYPEITGQTFYGFSELSMSSNYNDNTLMREKTGTDLFREFGVPAPQSAYYEVYVDYGEGPVYFGLYTILEVVFDTMLETEFGSNTGNCYKPDGDGAAWASRNFSTVDFGKKNNEATDWSDIQAVYDALHASTRTTDTTQYKADLEAVFNVDLFLKWLAANTTMQNWDTYGRMTHNYYLYNDPTNGMSWIPWDNNEAFEEGKQGGALSFELSEVSADDWPMIPYIADIPGYRAKYNSYIRSFIDTAFEPNKMQTQYNTQRALIESSVDKETSGYTYLQGNNSFSTAVNDIITHANTRYAAAELYLN